MSVGAPLLRVRDLMVSYGPAQALFGLSLDVEEGAVLAVLGANGAGKSTLARAVSGLVPITRGTVEFAGENITGRKPHRIRRDGLIYLPEGRGVFPGLSVTDNLRMAADTVKGRAARNAAVDQAFEIFPQLAARRRQSAGTLSGGEQQMLSLARALAVQPKLVIADEMSLGLAPKLVDQVFESLERAKQAGISIVLIEQFIHKALAFADVCVIVSHGRGQWSGPTADARGEVLRAYLGEAATASVG